MGVIQPTVGRALIRNEITLHKCIRCMFCFSRQIYTHWHMSNESIYKHYLDIIFVILTSLSVCWINYKCVPNLTLIVQSVCTNGTNCHEICLKFRKHISVVVWKISPNFVKFCFIIEIKNISACIHMPNMPMRFIGRIHILNNHQKHANLMSTSYESLCLKCRRSVYYCWLTQSTVLHSRWLRCPGCDLYQIRQSLSDSRHQRAMNGH